jgi:hypothetical protein
LAPSSSPLGRGPARRLGRPNGPMPGPRGLPAGAMYGDGCPTSYIRSQTSAPLQGRARRPCRPPQRSAPLVGFGPLRRISSRGVRSTRAFHTRHLPATGFLTLLPACSSSGRVGLFHPTNAHGVSLFRAFPSRRGDRLVTDRVPSCRCRWAPKRPSVGSRGLLPDESPFTPPGGLDPRAAATLLSFHPLQGSTFPAMGTASRPLPSCALGRSTRTRRVTGVPLSRGHGSSRQAAKGSPKLGVGHLPEGTRSSWRSGAGPRVGVLPDSPHARPPLPEQRATGFRADLDTAPLGPTSHGWHVGPLPSVASGGEHHGCIAADRSRPRRRAGTVPPRAQHVHGPAGRSRLAGPLGAVPPSKRRPAGAGFARSVSVATRRPRWPAKQPRPTHLRRPLRLPASASLCRSEDRLGEVSTATTSTATAARVSPGTTSDGGPGCQQRMPPATPSRLPTLRRRRRPPRGASRRPNGEVAESGHLSRASHPNDGLA